MIIFNPTFTTISYILSSTAAIVFSTQNSFSLSVSEGNKNLLAQATLTASKPNAVSENRETNTCGLLLVTVFGMYPLAQTQNTLMLISVQREAG